MRIEVEVGDDRHVVTVDPVADRADRYRLTLDGRTWLVDAVRLDGARLSLVVVGDGPTPGGASHDLGVRESGARGEIDVSFRAGTFRVIVDARRFRRSAGEGPGGPAGEQRVVAPMPGRVVRVLVEEGDQVAARQGLVVVEAMKMENELSAPRGGRVTQIAVQKGLSVEVGRLLVVVE